MEGMDPLIGEGEMDLSKLTSRQKAIRQNIRNFLMTANPAELKAELKISLDAGDKFRAEVIRELMGKSS